MKKTVIWGIFGKAWVLDNSILSIFKFLFLLLILWLCDRMSLFPGNKHWISRGRGSYSLQLIAKWSRKKVSMHTYRKRMRKYIWQRLISGTQEFFVPLLPFSAILKLLQNKIFFKSLLDYYNVQLGMTTTALKFTCEGSGSHLGDSAIQKT